MRPKIGSAVDYNKTGKAPSPTLLEYLFSKIIVRPLLWDLRDLEAQEKDLASYKKKQMEHRWTDLISRAALQSASS